MKHLFAGLGMLLIFPAAAQTGWIRYFPSYDKLISVQVLPDGYAFLVHGGAEIYQIRTDPDGNPQDTLHLGPVSDDIVPAAGGGFFKLRLEQPFTLYLEKLDPAGNSIWQKSYTSPQPASWPRLAALPDGGCYLLCANTFQGSTALLSNYVQRIDPDGTTLWANAFQSLTGSGNNTSRKLSDAYVMPDSSVVALYQDLGLYNFSFGRIAQVRADGTPGFYYGISVPDFGDYFFSDAHCVQSAADGSLLIAGNSGEASGGFHPASTFWGVVARYDPAVAGQADQVLYPPTTSQMTTVYGPRPAVAAPMTDGDMLVIVQKNTEAWLWRGTWDLQDTAWQRPLSDAGGFFPDRIERLNRIMYGTADHGAILGGVDSQGVFLQKIGMWGNDTAATYWPLGGQVSKDLDFDCGTSGPYAPLPHARVHLKSIDPPGFQITVLSDSLGQMDVYVPAGQWRASLAEPVAAIYGKDCLSDTLLWVADSLPAPWFSLSALRYAARLKGRIWSDANSNCQADEAGPGFSWSPGVILTHEGIDYPVQTAPGGQFSVAVDTGFYRLRIEDYAPGPFYGYYCEGDSVYLSTYASVDSVLLLWSRWQNSRINMRVRRDVNYNCIPDSGDPRWKHIDLRYSTAPGLLTNYFSSNDTGLAVLHVYGPGTVLIEPAAPMPDSLVCGADSWPHSFTFSPGPDGQLFEDTLLARYPRWHDSLYVCPGASIWGVTIDSAAVIVQPAIFLWEFQVPFYHHVFALPEIVTELYETLPPGQTDTLVTFVLTAANGCDSTVVVHYTTGLSDAGVQRMLRISPNPAQDFAFAEWADDEFESVAVFESTGRMMSRLDGISGKKKVAIRVGELPDGVFVVSAMRADGTQAIGKLVVRH